MKFFKFIKLYFVIFLISNSYLTEISRRISSSFKINKKNSLSRKKVGNLKIKKFRKLDEIQEKLRAAKACFSSLASIINPSFCWKPSFIKPECESGYEAISIYRNEYTCAKYCENGYKRSYFHLCEQICSNCKPIFKPYELVETAKLSCKENYELYEGKCEPSCNLYGFEDNKMVNCGPWACSSSTLACFTSILNMTLEVLIGLVEFVGFILSLGASSSVTLSTVQAKKNLKKLVTTGSLSLSFIKLGFSQVENLLKSNSFIVKFLKYAYKKIKEKISDDISEAIFKETFTQILENTTKFEKKEDSVNETSISDSIDMLDIFDVKDTVEKCRNGIGNSDCIGATIKLLQNFDPTGILSIVGAFFHPVCDSNFENLENFFNERKYLKKNTCKIFELTNFKGYSKIIDNLQIKDYQLINFDNQKINIDEKVSSVFCGEDTTILLFINKFDEKPIEPFIVEPNKYYQSLPDKYNDKISQSLICEKYYFIYNIYKNEVLERSGCYNIPKDLESGYKISLYNFFPESSYIKLYSEKGYKGDSIIIQHTHHPITLERYAEFSDNSLFVARSIELIQKPLELKEVQNNCIEFYEHCYYGGIMEKICFDKEEYVYLKKLNNSVRSLRIGKDLNPFIYTNKSPDNYDSVEYGFDPLQFCFFDKNIKFIECLTDYESKGSKYYEVPKGYYDKNIGSVELLSSCITILVYGDDEDSYDRDISCINGTYIDIIIEKGAIIEHIGNNVKSIEVRIIHFWADEYKTFERDEFSKINEYIKRNIKEEMIVKPKELYKS